MGSRLGPLSGRTQQLVRCSARKPSPPPSVQQQQQPTAPPQLQRLTCPGPPPAPAHLAPLLAVASAAVHRAAELCRSVRYGPGAPPVISKEDSTPVTIADFGVQALVSLELGQAYPHIPFVAEEDAGTLRRTPALLARVVDAVAGVSVGPSRPSPDAILDAIDHGSASSSSSTAPGPGPGTAPGPCGQQRWILDPVSYDGSWIW